MAEEYFIELDTYTLKVLKKIVQVHIQHLDEQIRRLQKYNLHSENDLDTEVYFLQVQKIDAKFLEEVLSRPVPKNSGWMSEVFTQLTGTNGKHK